MSTMILTPTRDITAADTSTDSMSVPQTDLGDNVCTNYYLLPILRNPLTMPRLLPNHQAYLHQSAQCFLCSMSSNIYHRKSSSLFLFLLLSLFLSYSGIVIKRKLVSIINYFHFPYICI